MNMFLYEFRAYRKATIIWALALAALAASMLAMFPAFARDAEGFRAVIESMPESMLQAFGVQLDTIASLPGYYAYTFMYISLCGAIQAMHLGASIVSKEFREKTADFLLAKPVGRGGVAAAKASAALALLLLTNAVYMAASSAVGWAVQEGVFPAPAFSLLSLTLLFIQLIFLALGLAAAMLLPRMRSVLPISLGTVFALFMIGMIGSSTGNEVFRAVSPFRYYEPAYIMTHERYEWPYLLAGAGIAAVCAAFSYWRYVRRDLPAG